MVKTPLVIQLANGMKMRAYPDCVESSLAFYVRWPDRLEIEWLRQNLSKGETVLDIGANIGLWSLLLADVVGKENVFAFEPGRVAFSRLKENFLLNGISDRQLMPVALGKEEKEVDFPDPDQPDTCASLLQDMAATAFRKVHQTTLDLLLPRFLGKKVVLVKIDVEGGEPEVFQGALKFCREIRPRLILFESFTPDHLERCQRLLHLAGYTLASQPGGKSPPSSPQNHFAILDE